MRRLDPKIVRKKAVFQELGRGPHLFADAILEANGGVPLSLQDKARIRGARDGRSFDLNGVIPRDLIVGGSRWEFAGRGPSISDD